MEMKEKIKYIMGGILVLLLGSIIIRSCTNIAVKKMNEISETTIEETTISISINNETNKKSLGKVEKCDERHVGSIVSALVNDAPVYWNNYNLTSEHFRSKFKSGIDILPELNSFVDGCGAGKENINGKNVIEISGITKTYESEKCGTIDQATAYYYDYVINDSEQLDDLIFLYKKVFPERIALTGERLDGKKDIYPETVSELLHYIANPYHNFDIIYTHNYSEESMPYSDTCKIINRPNLEEIGIPENSYDEKEGEDVYIIFEYPTKKIKWKVNYKVDDDDMFDYIEFIEVNI